jgi:dTDP-4-amino-4,6-dideoxygalactose transaminase
VAGEDPIPLFRSHVAPDAAATLAAALDSGALASGPAIAEFEAALGRWIGNPDCVATVDRAAALTLALRRCGVGPGTDVLVSPLSCLATTMPIANLHARPVWCDVDAATGMLDPAEIARRRTPATRAIIHYHWGGDVGPLGDLQSAARAAGLPLIADASAALGAEYRGARLGATGSDYTVLSFYAVNPLNTIEGGALCCPTPADAEAIRWQRRFGIHQPTFRTPGGDLNPASGIPVTGYSFAMTNVTARLGLCQLRAVDGLVARHQVNGRHFDAALRDFDGLTLLDRPADGLSAYWVYALRARHRDALVAQLHARGIGAQRLHLRNDRYSCFEPAPWPLPGVDAFDADNLAVPCGWWVGDEERARIASALAACP